MGHNGLCASPNKAEEMIDQFSVCGISGDRCVENMSVTDFFDPMNSFFVFQTINSCLI